MQQRPNEAPSRAEARSRHSPRSQCSGRPAVRRGRQPNHVERGMTMAGDNWDRVPIDAQSIDAPLSSSAIFLVVTVASGQEPLATVCSALGALDDLVKTVGFRDL